MDLFRFDTVLSSFSSLPATPALCCRRYLPRIFPIRLRRAVRLDLATGRLTGGFDLSALDICRHPKNDAIHANVNKKHIIPRGFLAIMIAPLIGVQLPGKNDFFGQHLVSRLACDSSTGKFMALLDKIRN